MKYAEWYESECTCYNTPPARGVGPRVVSAALICTRMNIALNMRKYTGRTQNAPLILMNSGGARNDTRFHKPTAAGWDNRAGVSMVDGVKYALIATVAPMAATLLFVFAGYSWPCLAAYIAWALAGPIASTVMLAILVSR